MKWMRRHELQQESHSCIPPLCSEIYSSYLRGAVPPYVSCKMVKQTPMSPTSGYQATPTRGAYGRTIRRIINTRVIYATQTGNPQTMSCGDHSGLVYPGLGLGLIGRVFQNLLKRKTSLHSCPPVRAYCSITDSGSGFSPCMI